KEVRAAAVELLACLPESRYAQRMLNRVRPLLSVKGLLRKVLDVSWPQECDQSMMRDGIEARSSVPLTSGDKQLWLFQMLSLVRPQVWEQHLKMNPEQLVSAVDQDEPYATVVLHAWEEAAIRHKDERWAEALVVSNCMQNLKGLVMIMN